VVPAAVLAGACEGMDALMRGEYGTGVPPEASPWHPGDDPHKLVKIEMPQVADRRIHALVSHPALGRLAARLTGARMVQVWWVQMLVKPPEDPGGASPHVGWHQDRQYWGAWEEGSQLFTAWVACSDVTAAAGPVRHVRGSHRWGLLGQGNFDTADADRQKEGLRLPPGVEWREIEAILPPGGVSFHDQLTLHGSTANRSGLPRRSFAIHLRTERSRPVGLRRDGLTRHIDDETYCPVIHRAVES
jgi:ectoine hydroxylase-related dioxygenase (phytanoyl-CoA dioxygenase family)